MAAGYKWEPLDPTKHSIRLLRILPVIDQDKTMRVTLHTTCLNALEPYDAVSYMWGSDTSMQKILIDGKVALVRENIWRFLIHVRDSSLHDRLNPSLCTCYLGALLSSRSPEWIDALTIDQTNNDEKNDQVRQMKTIFSRAYRVVAWLGDASLKKTLSDRVAALNNSPPPNDPQLHRIRMLERSTDPVEVAEAAPATEIWQELHDHARFSQWFSGPGLIGDDVADSTKQIILDDLHAMCESPYWSRLWIVQELAVARVTCCVSGSVLLSVDDLEKFAGLLDASNKGSDERLAPFWNTIKCVQIRHPRSAGTARSRRSPTLADVIKRLSHHHCMDIRDHVYGTLGCVKRGDEFDVDYAVSTEAVLLRSLGFCHEEDNTADLKECAEMLTRVLRVSIQDIFRHPDLRQQVTNRRYRIQANICSYFERVPPADLDDDYCVATEARVEIVDSAGVSCIFKCHVLGYACCHPHQVAKIPDHCVVECELALGNRAKGTISLLFHLTGLDLLGQFKISRFASVRRSLPWWERTIKLTDNLQLGLREDMNTAAELGQIDWKVLKHDEKQTVQLPCSFSSLVELYGWFEQEESKDAGADDWPDSWEGM
ncbi:hypothetical protein LTR97_001666 [Elasticomyces elasticus]|uniref:Heterokaryon incompatibility domain-containing protein n=1 Tax=Elasticomyces elasticus TaxID=574655 RepID=A0AAN8A575_9PEZI|nr:hypothetical protein LTR97_001666 [Elasticomyces elasticus]